MMLTIVPSARPEMTWLIQLQLTSGGRQTVEICCKSEVELVVEASSLEGAGVGVGSGAIAGDVAEAAVDAAADTADGICSCCCSFA